jgi:uncharacterized protein
MKRYFALSIYLRRRFGKRVRKIALDAGFSCPNRDGTLSVAGCTFCNPSGSGTSLGLGGMPIETQWDLLREKAGRKSGELLFWAYLQSFSNTHGPVVKLKQTLDRISALPDISGLCIGTRPDCVDQEKLNLISKAPFPETWLELGLQSSSDATLSRINRGHGSAEFTHAVESAAGMGLKICVHVIAGLPGEGEEDFLRTIEFVNAHPVHGIKFHNLYVCKETLLARLWRTGAYVPLTQTGYVQSVVKALALLRPDIIVHRLNADPGQGELLAPEWAMQKTVLLELIRNRLAEYDVWQGKSAGAELEVQKWSVD